MTSTVDTPDLLAAIVAANRRTVDVRAERVPLAKIEAQAAAVDPPRHTFKRALERPGRLNVIAECKRRSPARGVLAVSYDPARIARSYEQGGAAAISVLTEPTFFDGSLEHLESVRRATALPLLRKDFIIDRYQILEARAAGADAVLLIVAALKPAVLQDLHGVATDAGLDVLVEVHGLLEIQIAVEAGASIIGVNNRNLRTLSVDTEVSHQAIESIPDDAIAVAESGLKTGDDLRRLRAAGYDAFLVGERLMAANDPGTALSGLLKGALA
jgi:indole-3-glycerol phosphate synthase